MLRQRRAVATAVLLSGLLAGSVMPVFAQNATPAPAAEAQPAKPEPSPEQLAAAVQFLEASGLTSGFDQVITQSLQQINAYFTGQRPELTAMINQVTISLVPEFAGKRAELDRSLAKLYTEKFTVDELKQLTAFYQTPVGQKFSREQQDILAASPPVVQAWMRTLQEQMTNRIKQEVEKKGEKLQ